MALTPEPKMTEKSFGAHPPKGGLSQSVSGRTTPGVEGTAGWASSPARIAPYKKMVASPSPRLDWFGRSAGRAPAKDANLRPSYHRLLCGPTEAEPLHDV